MNLSNEGTDVWPQREQMEKKKRDQSGGRQKTWNLGTEMGDSDKVLEEKVFNYALTLWQSTEK